MFYFGLPSLIGSGFSPEVHSLSPHTILVFLCPYECLGLDCLAFTASALPILPDMVASARIAIMTITPKDFVTCFISHRKFTYNKNIEGDYLI